jgi:hypothetical protein
MALGFGLAPLAYGRPGVRRAPLVALGAGCLAGFVAVRALGLGDPSPWAHQPEPLFTALSFVNVNKYPPSTAFLLLTIGAAALGLVALDRGSRVLERFGRVPLFFYLVHIPIIHLAAVAYAYLAFGDARWLTSGPVIFWDVALPGAPPSYGFGLPGVYLCWAILVAALYPACRWFAARRRRYTTTSISEMSSS